MPASEASTRRCVSVVVLLAFALGACSSPAPVRQASQPTLIYDVRAKRFVDETALVTDLARARYRLLGEIHDDPLHHTIRARLLGDVARRGLHPAVVMEQFDLDHDAALRAAQDAGEDAEQVASAGRLDRKGWQWPLHEPIVAAALAHRLALRAGNLSRAALSGDLDAVLRAHPRLEARLRAARWTDAQAGELRSEIVESHCNMLPDAIVPKLVLGQRMRDAAMAQALVDDATLDGAVLIAGNGHVRDDLGVPVYLHAPGLAGAKAGTMSIGFIEVSADDERAADFPRRVIAAHPGFDVVFLTPAIARPDPCASFRRAPKG